MLCWQPSKTPVTPKIIPVASITTVVLIAVVPCIPPITTSRKRDWMGPLKMDALLLLLQLLLLLLNRCPHPPPIGGIPKPDLMNRQTMGLCTS